MLGEVITSILTACSSEKIRRALLSMKWVNKTEWKDTIGDSVLLSDSIRLPKWRHATGWDIFIEITHRWNGTLEDPYQAFLQKTPWPPADNFYDVDPISLLQVGDYNDNKSCACCDKNLGEYNIFHDNTKEHMVVLVYPMAAKASKTPEEKMGTKVPKTPEVGEAKRVAFNKHLLLS